MLFDVIRAILWAAEHVIRIHVCGGGWGLQYVVTVVILDQATDLLEPGRSCFICNGSDHRFKQMLVSPCLALTRLFPFSHSLSSPTIAPLITGATLYPRVLKDLFDLAATY